MEEITIYKYQLDTICDALRLTQNIHDSIKGETSFDRQIRQATQFAENAL
jgi:meiotically up-regulated gene 157 (Mug157) protein